MALLDAIQDRCGAACCPSAQISSTVPMVRSRVEPPAPNVTEKKVGRSCANCLRVARRRSMPSGVCGGKNSKEKVFVGMARGVGMGGENAGVMRPAFRGLLEKGRL